MWESHAWYSDLEAAELVPVPVLTVRNTCGQWVVSADILFECHSRMEQDTFQIVFRASAAEPISEGIEIASSLG